MFFPSRFFFFIMPQPLRAVNSRKNAKYFAKTAKPGAPLRTCPLLFYNGLTEQQTTNDLFRRK